jgi:hypothetical protein
MKSNSDIRLRFHRELPSANKSINNLAELHYNIVLIRSRLKYTYALQDGKLYITYDVNLVFFKLSN